MSQQEHTDPFVAVVGPGRGAGEGSRPDPLGLARFSVHHGEAHYGEDESPRQLLKQARERTTSSWPEPELAEKAAKAGWRVEGKMVEDRATGCL